MNLLHPTLSAALAPFIPQALPGKDLLDAASFNDDDVYVYDATSLELVKQYPCCLADVRDARAMGFRVESGNTWAKGMRAKRLGLWRKA